MYEQLTKFIKDKIEISEEDLETVLSYFKSISVKKNELLVSQGEFGQQLFFVTKGCIRIFFINEEGQESTRF